MKKHLIELKTKTDTHTQTIAQHTFKQTNKQWGKTVHKLQRKKTTKTIE